MEYILTDIRKGHMCNAKLLRGMPGRVGSGWTQLLRVGQVKWVMDGGRWVRQVSGRPVAGWLPAGL